MRDKINRDLVGGLTSFAIEAALIIALGTVAAFVAWIALAVVG